MSKKKVMKKIIFFSVFILIIYFFAGCKTIESDRPVESYTEKIILKPSIINVPLSFNINDVENIINTKFVGLIYEDNSYDDNGGDNLMVKAWKKENISINLSGFQISYRVPLKLWIKAGFKISKFGIEVSDYREINAEIALKYKTTIMLNKDWSLITKTIADGFEWISTPIIKIGPIDLPIKSVAGLILNANKDKLSNVIDKGIKDYFCIKKYVEQAWEMIQKPYKINEEYNIWLKVQPIDITTIPPISKGNDFTLMLGVKSITQVYMGYMPDTIINNKLPNFNIVSKIDPSFLLNINLKILFTTINEIAKKELIGKEFSSGKKKVTIKDINIYGSDKKFIIDIKMLGSFNGKAYLEGTPIYDDSSKSLKVKDIDFSVKTKNILIGSASWILHGTLIKALTPKLVYSIADKINYAKEAIQTALKGYQATEGVVLKGKLDDMDIDTVYITRDAANVIMYFKGNINVDLLKIDKKGIETKINQ